MAELGAVSQALECSRYVYARALEGLNELVKQADGVPPWLAAAQLLAFRYRESHESGLFGPAGWVVEEARLHLSAASHVWVGMGLEAPAPSGLDVNATGWGRSVAQCDRHSRQQSIDLAEEARRADIAASFHASEQTRKYLNAHGGSGCLLISLAVVGVLAVVASRLVVVAGRSWRLEETPSLRISHAQPAANSSIQQKVGNRGGRRAR